MSETKDTQSMSIFDRLKMYTQLSFASGSLIENLLLLFLKKNDAQLSDDAKRLRDQAESVVFYTSVIGKFVAFGILTRRLSFLNGLRFNPIKDIQTFALAYGTIFAADSLPITYYWESLEPHIFKIIKDQDEYVDIYANNLMNPFKLFYYVNLV